MANNRMFLLHVPSGYAIFLAKRLAWGWYDVPADIKERMEKLFQMVESQEAGGSQDDFAIALEDASESSLATDKWKYGEYEEEPKIKGIRKLIMPVEG